MFKGESQNNKKSIKKFLYLHAVILILFMVYSATLSYCSYKGGFTVSEPDPYFGVRFLLIIFAPLVLITYWASCVFIFFKIRRKYVFPSVILAIIFFLIFLYTIDMAMVKFPAKGYYDYVKTNVDIDEIHHWLINYKKPDYEFADEDGTKSGRVPDFDWPESIKALNPTRGVFIYESGSKKYIRISHAVDWELSIGLCVMEEPMDVPEYGVESRITLQDNAFIWRSN